MERVAGLTPSPIRIGMSPRSVLIVVLWIVVALEPLLFLRSFAGDAQVHLVFAENAARGRFFEFNPGERVSGETSPGYMLLGAALFKALPAKWVPVALKVGGGLVWYALWFLVFRVARRLAASTEREDNTFWPAVAASVNALVPGSVYNANVGMENGLFTALIWLWVDRAQAWGWMKSSPSAGRVSRTDHELILAALLGITCWVRPEGLVIVVIAYSYLIWTGYPLTPGWIGAAALALSIGVAALVFQFAFTGDLIPVSILSRRLLTMHRSLRVGPIWIDPEFGERLIAYLPVTAYFLLDLRRLQHRSSLWKFLVVTFGSFFVLYTFVTGAAQLSRYVMFLMPILAIGACNEACRQWERGGRRERTIVILAAFGFLGINVVECRYRAHEYRSDLLSRAMNAPAQRRDATRDMLRALGDPTKRPVVLALEAIQLRYELDDRFVIRSTDGRIDHSLIRAAHDDYVDYLTYLESSDIDYFFPPRDYDRRSPPWTVTKLWKLDPGESIDRGTLRFTKLASGALRNERIVTPAE